MKKIFTLTMAAIFCMGMSKAQQQPFSEKDFNKKSPVEQTQLLNQKGNPDKKFESVPGNSEDFVWEESSSSWQQITTTTFTYNNDGHEIDIIVKYFPTNNNWYKIHYNYDANAYRTERIIQRGDGSNWIDSSRTVYTRDGQNRVTEYLNQDYTSGNWVYKSRSV